MTLSCYSFGIILRRRTPNGAWTEYAVDPVQVAAALSTELSFCTGLLSEDILYYRLDGVLQTVVGYRKGQKTGLYLEGSEEPLRIPLPPLLMVRTVTGQKQPRYQVFAVKRRPTTLNAPLFVAPLPNVYHTGNVCWGSVSLPDITLEETVSLASGWQVLLGTPFGNHSVARKSQAHPADIREHYLALAARGTRVYPRGDLIPANMTLAQVLGGTRDS